MSNLRAELATVLYPHLPALKPGGVTLSTCNLLDLQLRPRDYLHFARLSLKREDDQTAGLLDAFNNMKKAMDSQVQIVLAALNLQDETRFQSSMPAKLDFLTGCGFNSGRGLKKLNHIRNKIEHEFSVPNVTDPELFLDLAEAFVRSCEAVVIFAHYREIELTVADDDEISPPPQSVQELVEQKLLEKEVGGIPEGVVARYDPEERLIRFEGCLGGRAFDIESTTSDWRDFEFCLKVMYRIYEFNMLGDYRSLEECLLPRSSGRR